jgi:biotin carboxyl carrier protein
MRQILTTWLFRQCEMLSGAKYAVLFIDPPSAGSRGDSSDESTNNTPLFWPDNSHDSKVLHPVAKAAFSSKKTVIKAKNTSVENTGEPLDSIACPLFLNDVLIGVIAIVISHRSKALYEAFVQEVQKGTRWLETMLLHEASTANEQLLNLVDLVSTGLEHEEFEVAVTQVANELSRRFSCERVSIGFLSNNRIRIKAISHNFKIDQQSKMSREIQEAMHESLDQESTIVYPALDDTQFLIDRFHAQLSKSRQGNFLCTLPLFKNATPVGVILMERIQSDPFNPETIVQCEQISLLLGPILETRRREELSLPLKIAGSFKRMGGKLFGPRHLSLKITAGLTLVLFIGLFMAGSMFRISCDSVLEPGSSRKVVAPQQGYIAQAHVRAGDRVVKGDLLASLDDRELIQEQRKWQSQHAQILKEYRKALSGFDRAQVAILRAKLAQAQAQLKLAGQQLDRTRLVAPFSGMIVKGDLSQNLGSPVTRGEVLFEVAPTDEYRVILKVDDRDIGRIHWGQQGQLKLSGISEKLIHISIDRMTPVSSNEGGQNYFRVEASMKYHSDLMRPGMEGVSKIDIGRKKLIWIWSRPLIDWLRLFAWKRLP